MKKGIKIIGKNNIDKINGVKTVLRNNTSEGPVPNYQEQVVQLNQLYLDQKNSKYKSISREIIKKIQGYKAQDIKKYIYDENIIISLDETIEKMVVSKLKCHYCYQEMKVMFTKARDETQWTLDRINNDLCHSNDNTVVACLKCNLQRRRQDAGKFTFTKQLRIKKYD